MTVALKWLHIKLSNKRWQQSTHCRKESHLENLQPYKMKSYAIAIVIVNVTIITMHGKCIRNILTRCLLSARPYNINAQRLKIFIYVRWQKADISFQLGRFFWTMCSTVYWSINNVTQANIRTTNFVDSVLYIFQVCLFLLLFPIYTIYTISIAHNS